MRSTEPMQGETMAPGEEALAGEPESWESWETWLVTSSVALGVLALFLLGWLVDRFVLT